MKKQQVNKIASLNPTFVSKDGFFAAPRDAEAISVEFTNPAEEQVINLISSFDDCSVDSPEVDRAQGAGDYINPRTGQFLHAFDLSNVQNALELSCDFGNISRLLGEELDSVESLKPSTNIAKASAYRCADLPNVGTVCGSLHDVHLPEAYYDLIVATDIEELVDDRSQLQNAIEKLKKSLAKGGVLALITANPRPVSAWFNDQGDLPYADLYLVDENSCAQADWSRLLDDAGLPERNEHCFLPNARNGKTLLAKTYLDKEASAINHFYGAGIAADEQLSEFLLFTELARTQPLFDLCDDYLTLCASDSGAVAKLYDNDFTHFSSSGRRLQWRTMTVKPRDAEQVVKYSLSPSKPGGTEDSSGSGFPIVQDLAPQSYQRGQSLAGVWSQTLIQTGATENFEKLLDEYHDWLEREGKEYGDAIYDLVPFNLIVDDQGTYRVIDPEWQVSRIATPEFVMFRALFWFGFQNRYLLRGLAIEHGLFCIEDFVNYGMRHLGYDYDLSACCSLETEIQASIEKQFNLDAIGQSLRLPIMLGKQQQIAPILPSAQVFWSDSPDSMDFKNSVGIPLTELDKTLELTTSVRGLDTSKPVLRVDPVDRAGFFGFEHIRVLDAAGDVLWSIEGGEKIAESAKTVNLVPASSEANILFIAQNDDPQFIFELPGIEEMANADSISLSLSYSYSQDYRAAMQELGHESLLQKKFIDSQRNELETTKARYSELDDNFNFLKDTSVNQNDLIELQKSQIKNNIDIIEKQQQALGDQQAVIETQLEMMQRTFGARVRNFIAGLRGQSESPEEQPDLEDEAEPEPVVAPKPEKLGQTNEDYEIWIEQHELSEQDKQRIKQEIEAMAVKPKFSVVVPVYNIDEEYLMLAIASVRNQLYPHWELCLVDDASPKAHIRPMLKRLAALDERIVVRLNKANQGIAGASNDGVRMTTGDYIGLLDHDDELSIDALFENAKVINQTPDIGFIYSDEDKVTMDERRVDPFFKPDYSPDLLDSQNYICHFSVMSQEVVEKIGGFRLGFDGSQDHDIIIRAIESSPSVAHIPKVLYHWRKVPGSTAEVYDAKAYAWEAGRKAVQARLDNSGETGEVVFGPLQGTYQVKREIVGNPKISIIIPFKDRADLLKTCIDSILENSGYENFEIIGVSNNSEEEVTKATMAAYQESHPQIRFVEKNVPFNFSEICNYGVEQSKGDYILLLNNDIEIRSQDWLIRLLEHAQRQDVGAVGGKLFFPDGRIQHAGVVAGMHGAAGHSHLYFAADDIGYYGSLMVTRDVSAVTGAMLMVSRAKYDEVGGLDAENLAVAYNDVDFCLSLVKAGYRNIYTPFVHAIHNESASRGYEDNEDKLARLERERDFFVQKWQAFLEGVDPCFNPNFDLGHFNYKIRLDERSVAEVATEELDLN